MRIYNWNTGFISLLSSTINRWVKIRTVFRYSRLLLVNLFFFNVVSLALEIKKKRKKKKKKKRKKKKKKEKKRKKEEKNEHSDGPMRHIKKMVEIFKMANT